MDNINKSFEEVQSFSDVKWNTALEVTLAGVSHCNEYYRIGRPPGKTFVFEYVVSGHGTLEVEGIRYYPSGGDVYIAPGWRRHLYYSNPESPWVKYWFNLNGLLPEMLLKAYSIDGVYLFRNAVSAGEIIRESVEKIKKMDRSKIPSFMENMIFQVIRQLANRNGHQTLSGNTAAENLAAWLRTRITKPAPSLNEMARHAGFSPVHTIRLFRQATGRSPLDYLLEEKMQLARELLRSTRKTLKEIADSLGFTDEFYFSRQFSKRCGIPPAAFRKQFR